MTNLKENIKNIRSSIVAIGFNPSPDKITILGSGFLAQGKIITVAHLLNNLTEEQVKGLKANVMIEQKDRDLERYQWFSIKLVPEKYNKKDDLAVFEFIEKPPVINELELGDSETIEVGQDVYFVGFPYASQLINDGFGITLVVNKGIVSNIKRDGMDSVYPRNWFIIDAISNPGNSGCPVIDIETNKVIGVMSISFRTKSQVQANLDIREPMHIAGAKPINLAKNLLK
jgi:S1-C subfamily serine protease